MSQFIAKAVRFSPEQWAKFCSLGGPTWLRATLDGVPMPQQPEAKQPAKRARKMLDAAYLRGRGGISGELQRAWFDGQTLRGER